MAQTDRDALVALHNATGGAEWTNNHNWNTDADLSRWHGVNVDTQGRVVELRLGHNNLRGPIPPELGKLAALKVLDLSGNELTGPIPKELGALSALRELRLYSNQLSGHIPPELGALCELRNLSLYSNKLTGHIPPELGKLAALEELSLRRNKLSGSIPSELGNLPALKELCLGVNQLSGPIPPELGKLAALETLELQWNQLSGPIPKELGALSELEQLVLPYNGLTGPIPRELGNLAALRHLSLGNNSLTGHIPRQLGDLGALKTLNLRYNELDGDVPRELAQLQSLSDLRLSSNPDLIGPIPPEHPSRDREVMQTWRRVPTEAARAKLVATDRGESGDPQPFLVRAIRTATKLWHTAVPVVDDYTDFALLWTTRDDTGPVWWLCLLVLLLADVERLWFLATLCITLCFAVVLLPCLLWGYFFGTQSDILDNIFARLNCNRDVRRGTLRGRVVDTFLWALIGSRARCTPIFSLLGLSGNATKGEIDDAGVGFSAIDEWVARHPFHWLGMKVFRGFELKGSGETVTRRAGVMIRAVGETIVVDPLFFLLSVLSGGLDGGLTGFAGVSALFSVLELLTELQYYVEESAKELQPVSSPVNDHASVVAAAAAAAAGSTRGPASDGEILSSEA